MRQFLWRPFLYSFLPTGKFYILYSLIIETINTFERPDKIYARKILRNLESVCKLFGKQSGGYHKRSIASFYVSIPWKSDLKVNITSGILKQDLVLQVFQSPWNSCDPPVVYSHFRNYAPPLDEKGGIITEKVFPVFSERVFLGLFWLSHINLGVYWHHRKKWNFKCKK